MGNCLSFHSSKGRSSYADSGMKTPSVLHLLFVLGGTSFWVVWESQQLDCTCTCGVPSPGAIVEHRRPKKCHVVGGLSSYSRVLEGLGYGGLGFRV